MKMNKIRLPIKTKKKIKKMYTQKGEIKYSVIDGKIVIEIKDRREYKWYNSFTRLWTSRLSD